MSIPQIANGKKADEMMNVKFTLPLPADTPFGNMYLKHMKIIYRLDHVNRKLAFVYQDWGKAVSKNFDPFHNPMSHLLWIEEIVYFLRVTYDEIISLAYLVFIRRETQQYPDHIKIKDIGSLLNSINSTSEDHKKFGEMFRQFFEWLDTFNKITNAYKHSFINSDQTIIGRDEPCVPVLNMHHNNLKHGYQFYNLRLADIVEQFNKFYEHAFSYIKENAEPHLKNNTE